MFTNYRGGMREVFFLNKIFVYHVFFTSREDKLRVPGQLLTTNNTSPRCARFSRSHTQYSFSLPLWHSRNPLFNLKSKLLSLRRHPKAAKNSSRKTDSREREACYPLWDVLQDTGKKKKRRSIALQKISLTPTETSSRMEKAML